MLTANQKDVVFVLQLLSCVQLLCNPMDCSPPGSSVHEIYKARILEWIAIPFSRGSSQPGDRSHVSCIAGGLITSEPPGKPTGVPLIITLYQFQFRETDGQFPCDGQFSLSITNSQSLLKLISIQLMPSNHYILCHPLLLPLIFPSIRVFSNESALLIRWPKY